MGVAPSDLAVMVTGGARGLGRAMALGLAQTRVRVAVADLPSSQAAMGELLDLARVQRLQERIHPVDCDVTRWDDCTAAVRAAVERFGAVHGLVNNAGVGMQHIGNVVVGARKKFYEVDADTWRNAIDVNFNGPFMMAKAIAPTLVAQGWGRVVRLPPRKPDRHRLHLRRRQAIDSRRPTVAARQGTARAVAERRRGSAAGDRCQIQGGLHD
jgi:3-oxoacyl-[acyl-carrier protein] reductase